MEVTLLQGHGTDSYGPFTRMSHARALGPMPDQGWARQACVCGVLFLSSIHSIVEWDEPTI
jgi:hypothetical protein